MRLSAYVILLFSISVMAYLFGYPSVLLYLYEQNAEANQDPIALIQEMAIGLLNPANASTLLGVGAVITIIVLAGFLSSGFIAVYLVPMIILMLVLNLMVFPLSFIFDAALPFELKIIFVSFFNILTILASMNFIRGSV